MRPGKGLQRDAAKKQAPHRRARRPTPEILLYPFFPATTANIASLLLLYMLLTLGTALAAVFFSKRAYRYLARAVAIKSQVTRYKSTG